MRNVKKKIDRKILLAFVLFLVAVPLCYVVWAGLDAAGGSVVNCRAILSDSTSLNLRVTGGGAPAPILILEYDTDYTANSLATYTGDFTITGAIVDNDLDVSVNIVPTTHDLYDLGSAAKGFNTCYFSESVKAGASSADYRIDAKAGGVVGSDTFTGSGLDDLTAGGTLTGTVATDVDYKVEIDANGTPDTFKWTDAPGVYWSATGVAITGSAQTLNNGITVTFGATDGHTTGDYWEFTVTVFNPMWLQDADGDGIMHVGNDGRVGILDETPSYPLDVNGVVAGTSIYAGNGTEGDPSITFASDSSTGMYLVSGGRKIGFSIDGSKILHITDSGGGNELELTGDASISGSVTANNFFTGGDIGVSADTDLLQLAANALTVNGSITASSLVVDTTTLVVNAAGYADKVGIGTATPGANTKLHVAGGRLYAGNTGAAAGVFVERTDGVWGGLFFGNTSGNFLFENGMYFNIQEAAADDTPFDATYPGLPSYLTVRSGGNVGIGTANPQNRLDVEGAMVVGAGFSGSDTAPANGMLIGGDVAIGVAVPGTNMKLHVAGGRLYAGNTGAAAGVFVERTDGVWGGLFFGNTSGNFLFENGTAFNIQEADPGDTPFDATYPNLDTHLHISSGGDIGINESSPQDKLEVNGTVLVKDKLIFTQDDRNEYIDSLADGYMDYRATTAHRFNTTDLVIDAVNNRVGIGTASPSQALQMGDDKLIAVDVNAGLTASTTQSQGQGALTAQVNQISTVANDDDTVTLPAAVTGVEVEIINDGVNTLQIFPASGDDLGLGVNTAEELEANERVAFVAYDTTNWAKESSTEIIHAEIHDEDNADAFVINDAGGDFHSYHTNGLAAGDLADWIFDAGGAGTSHAITGIADAGGGDITVTTGDAHNLAVGDIISQTNLTDAAYVGVFDVLTVPTGTTYTVTATYTATGTGTMDQAATLEADAVAAGVYSFAYYISATPVGNNETFDFQLYVEANAVTGSKIRRKFGAANDFGSMSGGGVVAVGDGDKISFALSNEDSSANIIIRNLTIVLVRL